MKEITHRDEIHGDVRFDPLAAALLDTPAMQRLGRIYQLGYGHLVYRGGNHTRLSHVMGAYHAAAKLVAALQRNYLRSGTQPAGAVAPGEFLPLPNRSEQLSLIDRWDILRHLVCWAALLHDIAHVPLGHTLEDEFDNIYTKHDDFTSPRIPYLWLRDVEGNPSDIKVVFGERSLYPKAFERAGIGPEATWKAVMLTCLFKEKHKELEGKKRFEDVLRVELKQEGHSPFTEELAGALREVDKIMFFPYMADIVGNTICADYLDYLQRDPSNLGLDVLRDDRVVSRFWIGKDHLSQFRMALSLSDSRGKPRLDTCTGVVELVRQRFRFAEIVYYHKTKVAASAMLAKVFHLLGNPDECGPRRRVISLKEVEDCVADLMKPKKDAARVEAAQRLKISCGPNCLLDPEVGDESLHFMLVQRAWDILENSARDGDAHSANKCLRAISLLQALARRRLHKVCFTIDYDIYSRLYGGGTVSQENLERELGDFIKKLREKADERQRLESVMVQACGWPTDSLILYVPPRKSQAKGIETWALTDGHVVTLGDHVAVKVQVNTLSEQYKGLWKLLVLVAPEYKSDALGLSKAVDALIQSEFPGFDFRTGNGVIESAAWFPYIEKVDRAAADRCQKEEIAGSHDWVLFRRVNDTVLTHVDEEEYAARGMLLWNLARMSNEEQAVDTLKREFVQPGSLLARVHAELEGLSREGYKGDSGSSLWATAINRVAEDLMGNLRQPQLFR